MRSVTASPVTPSTAPEPCGCNVARAARRSAELEHRSGGTACATPTTVKETHRDVLPLLYDCCMHLLSPKAWKVVCYVARASLGDCLQEWRAGTDLVMILGKDIKQAWPGAPFQDLPSSQQQIDEAEVTSARRGQTGSLGAVGQVVHPCVRRRERLRFRLRRCADSLWSAARCACRRPGDRARRWAALGAVRRNR